MNDTITLTLAELAIRWQQTPAQALEAAVQRSLPVYFYFDGLVFDFADKWHRAKGHFREQTEMATSRERLLTVESDLERQNLARRRQLKLSKWEHAMSDEELQALRTEAEGLAGDLARLAALLEEREVERQRHVQSGLLRAAPKTLHEIAKHGSAKFPQFAYLPAEPGLTTHEHGDDQPAPAGKSDGVLLALEDGFPVKAQLDQADLCVLLPDVEAVEVDGNG
jgi:hypothetical protein